MLELPQGLVGGDYDQQSSQPLAIIKLAKSPLSHSTEEAAERVLHDTLFSGGLGARRAQHLSGERDHLAIVALPQRLGRGAVPLLQGHNPPRYRSWRWHRNPGKK